jgi:inorganic pyrophosphatase
VNDPIDIEVEVPRGGFVKRVDGAVDFVSPLPCPFNYGAVPGTEAADGDRLDALVLGPRVPAGTVVRAPVRATVRFVDAGMVDDKLVCSHTPLTEADRRTVRRFFSAYARLKGWLNRLRGLRGSTRFVGLEEAAP